MLKPSVQVGTEKGILVAEFWDCLRLDPAPVRNLRAAFEAHLQSGGRPDLVIDCLGVSFAGSAALGGFVAIQRLSRSKGGRMVFCNVDLTVHEVFRVSKLDNLFTFSADRPSAILELTEASAAEPGTSSPEPPKARPRTSSPGTSRLRRRPRDA